MMFDDVEFEWFIMFYSKPLIVEYKFLAIFPLKFPLIVDNNSSGM